MTSNKPTTTLIIPTFNAEKEVGALVAAIKQQTLQPDKIFFIDSSSTDQTVPILKTLGIIPHIIKKESFDHGGTRQLAVDLNPDSDIYIFLTHDALPADEFCFEKLIQPFIENEKIGCVYGRQLPQKNATPLAAHARLFNYPETSQLKRYEDKNIFGIKTCFNSDSFAAYRKQALKDAGGFPNKVLFAEDFILAALMLKKNWFIYYCAEAKVFHSHNYHFIQEFQRYYKIGKVHRQYDWILKEFQSPTREGFRYVASEMRYLIKTKNFLYIPVSLLSIAAKLLGYRLGRL
jgi:rhamnosyltransferase